LGYKKPASLIRAGFFNSIAIQMFSVSANAA